MSSAKVIVLYPTPRDVNAFERVYTQEHVPMVTAQNFKGIQKFVASRVVGTADGTAPPFYRLAELHFPSLEALQAAAGSASAQEVVAHAISISSGGKPVFLVAEEETKTF
jgi:uncharacterized protein (TIGR02118 family)